MKNDKNIESFDSIFKESLGNAGSPVPPGVWEGIAGATTGSAAVGTTSLIGKLLGWKGVALIGGAALVTTVVLTIPQEDTNTESDTPASKEVVISEDTEPKANNTEQTETIDLTTSHNEHPETTVAQISPNILNGEAASTNADNSGTADVAPPTNGNGQQTENSKPIHEPSAGNQAGNEQRVGSLTLESSTIRPCVNQEVTLTLGDNRGAYSGTVLWSLNGKPLSGRSARITLLVTQSGLNTIVAEVLTDRGSTKFRKTLDAQNISAEFTVEEQGNALLLHANHHTARHSWYVNNEGVPGSAGSVRYPARAGGSYEIVHIASNLQGCNDTSKQIISLTSCDFEAKVFPGFTPHLQDGINDEWVVELPPVEYYYLSIFSTSGEKVFESTDQDIHWNGKRSNVGDLLPVGSYTYQLVYRCGEQQKSKSGKLNLL